MKKIIVITQRIEYIDKYSEIRESLDSSYLILLRACGYIPIVISYTSNIAEVMNKFKVDGVVLSGGNDLNTCNKNKSSALRDNFEDKLISYCIDNSIPILGICRGLQVIANYFGSTFTSVKNQVAIKHQLLVNPKSYYYDNLIKLKKVNSYHNYGVKELSVDLFSSAYSEEGIIKAIEHRKYKIFAQMWHPEREVPLKKSQINIIKSFFG